MYCPKCGTQNPEDAEFCSSCGTNIQTFVAVASQPTTPANSGAPTQGQLASRGLRLAAKILDGVAFVGTALLGFAAITVIPTEAIVYLPIIAFFILQVVWLSTRGQTVGKRMVGIKIVSVKTGTNLGFVSNVVLRDWLTILLGIIPAFGLIDILLIFRNDRRCIHDLIAGTSVVMRK